MSYLIAASRIDLAEHCIGSTALPRSGRQTEAARLGIAVHAFLEQAAKIGPEEALTGVVDSDVRAICERIDTERIEFLGHATPELGFGYDPVSGDVAWAQRDSLEGDALREWPVVGYADLACDDPQGFAYVADYKTGQQADHAADSRQLRFLCLMAAAAFGHKEAWGDIIHTTYGRQTSVHFGALELEAARAELRILVEKAKAAKAKVEAGEPESLLKVGPWCDRCPSLPYCPAQMKLVKILANDPEDIATRVIAMLTPETAGIAYARWKSCKAAINRIGEALHAYASQAPIDLGDGKFYGARRGTKSELDGRLAYDTLVELHGVDVAKNGISIEASKASVERALKGRVPAVAPAMREFLATLEKLGGVTKKETSRVEEFKP